MRNFNTRVTAFLLMLGMILFSLGSVSAEDSERSKLEKAVVDSKKSYEKAFENYLSSRRKLIEFDHKKSPFSGQLNAAKEQLKEERSIPTSKLYLIGDKAEVGNLIVSIKSFGVEKRKFNRKSILGESTPYEKEYWGALVEVENTSKGRVICPFDGDSFLSKLTVIDSWDNRVVQLGLGRFDKIEPQDDAGFVMIGEDVLPGKTQTYLLTVSEMKVVNFEYVTFVMKIQPSNKGDEETLAFVIPKEKVLLPK